LAEQYITANRVLFDTCNFSTSNICAAETLRLRYSHNWQPLDFLHQVRVLKTTDPRDKIYALLSMPSFRNWEHTILVDYHKTTQEVLRRFVDLFLKDQTLDPLSYICPNPDIPASAPSWIPQ